MGEVEVAGTRLTVSYELWRLLPFDIRPWKHVNPNFESLNTSLHLFKPCPKKKWSSVVADFPFNAPVLASTSFESVHGSSPDIQALTAYSPSECKYTIGLIDQLAYTVGVAYTMGSRSARYDEDIVAIRL